MGVNNFFNPEEWLYRVVKPIDMYIRRDGSITSAAFKDKNGLSVDRGMERKDAQVVDSFRSRNFTGKIVKVSVEKCNKINACVKYLPSRGNRYHSEIHNSDNEKILESKKAIFLAKNCVFVSEKR